MTLRYMSKTRPRYKEVDLTFDKIGYDWLSWAVGELDIWSAVSRKPRCTPLATIHILV